MDNEEGKVSFWRFLVSRIFLKHLGIAMLVLIILFFVLKFFLNSYTDHGQELEVPDFRGYTIDEIDSLGYGTLFDLFIIDSLYDEDSRPRSIVIQNPEPTTMVKKGRNIYFTVVAQTPELVFMPNLKDLTLRQAINILESNRLQTGKLQYMPSFDKNAVLEQFFDGDTVFPGDTLVKGSVIDLVVGSGDRNYKIPVPFLIGKSREEAIYELNIASFNLGSEFYLDTIIDNNQRVFMQEPMWDTDLPFYPGDSIHLWYRSDSLMDFDAYLQTFLPDSLQADSLAIDSTLFDF